MEKPENHSSLPKVEQDDLLAVYIEELESKNHIEQWFRFKEENPVLGDEILSLAYKELERSAAAGENRSQVHMRILYVVAFSARAMQVALERQRRDENNQSTIVGDDGEGQQL